MEGSTTNMTTVADCLQFLDMAGWSELIDPRWRRQVEKDLKAEFGGKLTEDVLKAAMSVVLFPDIELSEGKYEYLDQDEDFYRDFLERRKIESGWNRNSIRK